MPRLLHPNRKFERITRTIQRQITTGRLTVGQKLPPEREMARRYRIGRVSVREAYRSLEQRGLVIVRRGAEGGTFIAQPDPVVLQESLSLLLGHTLTSPLALQQAQAFEPMVARLAARVRASHGHHAARTGRRARRAGDAGSGPPGSAGRPVPRRSRGLYRERAVHSAHGSGRGTDRGPRRPSTRRGLRRTAVPYSASHPRRHQSARRRARPWPDGPTLGVDRPAAGRYRPATRLSTPYDGHSQELRPAETKLLTSTIFKAVIHAVLRGGLCGSHHVQFRSFCQRRPRFARTRHQLFPLSVAGKADPIRVFDIVGTRRHEYTTCPRRRPGGEKQ